VQNVEIKAELRDPALARQILIAPGIGATWILQLRQTDTYYKVPAGRLKKRECPGEPTEYIFYDRSDKPAARLSHFKIYSEAQAAERFGTTPLPVMVVVPKIRDLYMLGNVRIHLDQVENLGWFVELEALVSPQHSVAACHQVIADLRAKLAPVLGETIAVGYSDLLLAEKS
jgi:adenylate cyclase, class 2